MKSKKWALILCAALTIGTVGYTQLDKVLKGAGIVIIIDKFGGEIDKAINKLTNTPDNNQTATKVVPIVTVGRDVYAGAAQVMGPKRQVDQVQAVAQLEGSFSQAGVRLKGLVPISTKNPGKNLKRVPGVGISGLIDIRL